jgi:hypothetical protein
MRLVFFVFLVVLTACADNRPDKKPRLDRNDIDSITVIKYPDTVQYRLTEEQYNNFLSRWDTAVSQGPIRFTRPHYKLTVYYKNDSTFIFNVRNNLIQHRLQECVDIHDKMYVENLWRHLVGLSDNHYEFLPTYRDEKKDEIYQVVDRQEAEYRETIKQVLTHYNHTYKEVGARIFYEGEISEQVLLDYTEKSKDSEWLEKHLPPDTLLLP